VIVLPLQRHAKVYPTLAKIALDVLPVQASSVPCKQLFSAGKEIAVDRRAQLGAELFEQLQVLKCYWKKSVDEADLDTEQVEEIRLEEYRDMLLADVQEGVTVEAGSRDEGSEDEVVDMYAQVTSIL
jgi:hypothetical protein